MSRVGTVNYHIDGLERYAYRIDADGVVGALVSPEHAVTDVTVSDVRTGEASVTFAEDGVAFARVPTRVESFTEGDWRSIYDRELTELLSRELGAKEVIVFDHTVRVDDPNSARRPARNVHCDYSADGARRRLRDLLGEERASEWSRGHYAFVNIWRPVDDPINSAPLGFVRPSSVREDDWVPIELIYPDRIGHIMGLVANEAHQWVYRSKMTPDEVAFFNIHDNRGRPSVGHSALDLVEDRDVDTIRKSVESRTLIRY